MSESKIAINQADKKQKMEGFGASGAWWAQNAANWPESELSKLMELLFDSNHGIGLTIYRYNIGAGNGEKIPDCWRRTESFEISEGKYDWNRDAHAVSIMKLACDKGVERIVAFANSPTARMSKSRMTSGHQEGKSNLQKGMEEQFAQYLIDVVTHLIEDEGLPVHWISPINEPMWLWNEHEGQEGCHYTPEESLHVYQSIARKIEENDLQVRLSAIEAGEWSSARMYYYKLAEDKMVMSKIDNIAVHSYLPQVSNVVYKEEFSELIRQEHPSMNIWMSEWTEMEHGADYGMESGLLLANVIHEDLTVGQVTSWQYWIAVSKYDYRDGLIYFDESAQRLRETKRLWTLGNYSKYIRPGDVRIEAQATHPELKVVAYTDGQMRVTLVVINNSKENRTAEIDFGNHADAKILTFYETSDDYNLHMVYSGLNPNEWSFKAKSVTTLVIQL